jgi:myo-inositol 2-dehydrogenase/D-chiro-inositol 1-dehydrogenase
MRVAVIGAGSMGGKHAELLAGLPEVKEVLVVDTDAARAAAVAASIGPSGRAVDEGEAYAADAVVVATPAPLHEAAVRTAVERDVPVLCEKPLTETLGTARALCEAVERAGAHVQMGFQRRHDPGFVAAREAIATGAAGKVHLLRLTAFDPLVPPRAASDWPEGEAAPIFLHSSIHDFDFARWLTGSEVVELTADGSRRDDPRPDDPRGLETAVVTMRHADGALTVLEATWLHPGGYDIRAELVAERAHLTMGLSPRTPARHHDWAGDGEPPAGWTGYLERFEPAYRAELIAFLAAVRGESPPTSSARDGLEALRIAVAATRAYRERRAVSPSEV